MTRPASGRAETEISTDGLFRALGASPRRIVLFHLRQNGAATIRELTNVVVELQDLEREVGATGAAGRRRLRTALEVYHLPLLERYGLVTYDRIRDVVEAALAVRDASAWLDLAISRELQGTDPEADAGGRRTP